jgi:hypothetical protein
MEFMGLLLWFGCIPPRLPEGLPYAAIKAYSTALIEQQKKFSTRKDKLVKLFSKGYSRYSSSWAKAPAFYEPPGGSIH